VIFSLFQIATIYCICHKITQYMVHAQYMVWDGLRYHILCYMYDATIYCGIGIGRYHIWYHHIWCDMDRDTTRCCGGPLTGYSYLCREQSCKVLFRERQKSAKTIGIGTGIKNRNRNPC